MNVWRLRIHFICKELFQYSLIAYLILFLAETLNHGLVSYFFNLNILLFVVLISAFIMALTQHEKVDRVLKVHEKGKLKSLDFVYILLFSVIGALVVYFTTRDSGFLSIGLSIFVAFLIFLLSLAVQFDN